MPTNLSQIPFGGTRPGSRVPPRGTTGGGTTQKTVSRTRREYAEPDPQAQAALQEVLGIARGIGQEDPTVAMNAAFNDMIRQVTEGYQARGSAGARSAREAGYLSGLTPLESAGAAEEAQLANLRNMFPAISGLRQEQAGLGMMRQQQLGQLLPLWTQIGQALQSLYTTPGGSITEQWTEGGMQPGIGAGGAAQPTGPSLLDVLHQLQLTGGGQRQGPDMGYQGMKYKRPDYSNVAGGFLAPMGPQQQPAAAAAPAGGDISGQLAQLMQLLGGGGAGAGQPGERFMGGGGRGTRPVAPITTGVPQQDRMNLFEKMRGWFGAGE